MISLLSGNSYLWQWNTGQRVILDDTETATEVSFSVDQVTAIRREVCDSDGEKYAEIPNILLQTAGMLYVYVHRIEGDQLTTVLEAIYQIRSQPKLSDYVNDEQEILSWHQLDERITALENGSSTGGGGLTPGQAAKLTEIYIGPEAPPADSGAVLWVCTDDALPPAPPPVTPTKKYTVNVTWNLDGSPVSYVGTQSVDGNTVITLKKPSEIPSNATLEQMTVDGSATDAKFQFTITGNTNIVYRYKSAAVEPEPEPPVTPAKKYTVNVTWNLDGSPVSYDGTQSVDENTVITLKKPSEIPSNATLEQMTVDGSVTAVKFQFAITGNTNIVYRYKSAEVVRDGLTFWLDGRNQGGQAGKWIDTIGGVEFELVNASAIQNGVHFTGTESYAKADNSDSHLSFPDTGTIEVSYKLDTPSAMFILFSSSGQDQFSIGKNGAYIAVSTTVSNMFEATAGSGAANVLNTMSATKNTAYLNRQKLVKSSSKRDNWSKSSNEVRVNGRNTGTNYAITGDIYSIRIYNRQLTDDEILQNQAYDAESFKASGTMETVAATENPRSLFSVQRALSDGAILKYKTESGRWEPISQTNGSPDSAPLESPLKNRKVSVIADSTLTVSDNCIVWLEKWTGMIPQNMAVSGSGFVAGGSGNYISKVPSIDRNTDIIAVGFGFNDTRRGIPVGSATDTGTSTLAGYVNEFFTTLVGAFPATPIVCFSEGTTNDRRPGVEISDQWHKVIGEICYKNCIPFYRGLYDGSILKPWIPENRSKYFRDAAHPNALGGKVMAKYLQPILEENLV